MENEIRRLMINQSNCGKFIDKNFIRQLVSIVTIGSQLEKYVHYLVYEDLSYIEQAQVICAYNKKDKRIIVDPNMVEEVIVSKDYEALHLDSSEMIFYKNMIIAECILHELVHANQEKQKDSTDTDIETQLIKIVDKTFQSSNHSLLHILLSQSRWKKYMQNYDICPIERLAEIKSHQTLLNIVAPISRFVPNIYNLEQYTLAEKMIEGYQEKNNGIIAPTPLYLKRLGHKKDWKEFDFYSDDQRQLEENIAQKYSLEQRLTLGLPITKTEYQNQTKTLVKK